MPSRSTTKDACLRQRTTQEQVANWRGLLTGSVEDGRQLLREALETPLKFERVGQTYKFSATVATGRLIAGAEAIGLRGQECMASPTANAHLAAASFLRGHVLRRAA